MGDSCSYIFHELLYFEHLAKYPLVFRSLCNRGALEMLFLHTERARVVLKLILGATGRLSWGKTMQGEDICTLTFKGAYRSTNWVISGNIKALFLWDLKEKNVITSSTKHESFQYPSFLSPENEKRFTLKRHFLWLHVLEPHKCKPSPPFFFWRKKGASIFPPDHGPFKWGDRVPSFLSVPLFDLSVITLELKLYRRPGNLVIIDMVLSRKW